MSFIVHEKSQASPLLARVHASEIVSALVNLVVNAIDAMPKGGRITVRTGAKDGGVFVEVADDLLEVAERFLESPLRLLRLFPSSLL